MPQLSRGAHKCADEIDVLGALSLSAGSASAECSRVCPFMWCRQLDEHLSWTAPGKVWRVVSERSSLGPTGKNTPAFSSPSKPSVVRRGYKKGAERERARTYSFVVELGPSMGLPLQSDSPDRLAHSRV